MVAVFFIPHRFAQDVNTQFLKWATVVYSFALALGSISLWGGHWTKVRARREGWPYSGVTLLGGVLGVSETTPVGHIYNAVNAPLQSTMFSLLAFVIASAAFRAFRA